MESENRQELKIVIRNTTDFIKISKFIVQNNFNIHHPSRLINSFYFDNNFKDHKYSIEGITPRKKIRIRAYGNSKNFKLETCNLEKKITFSDGKFKIIKKWNMLKKNNNLINIEMLNHENQILKKTLIPTIAVTYYRDYYINADYVRCTIDRDIKYSFFKLNKNNIEIKNTMNIEKRKVFEIKNKKNTELLLEKIDLHWQRFSKYSNGISRLS